MRDLRADSRFDIMRLRLRSSMTETVCLGSSEPEFELVWIWFGSSEPELDTAGIGDWFGAGKGSGKSHGVNSLSKSGKGFPNIISDEKMAGQADNMAQNFLNR